MFACGVRSARERSFEEDCGETEVGRGLLVPVPRPLPPLALRTRPRHANRTHVETATFAGVILPETGQFLLLCSLQLWQQLQRYRQTRARVKIFKNAFYFCSTETVLREWNVSSGSERLHGSARVKKRTAGLALWKGTRYYFVKLPQNHSLNIRF